MKRIRTIKKALIKNRKLSQRAKRPGDELESRDDMKVRKSGPPDHCEAQRSHP